MTDLADVDGFKICIQVCELPGLWSLLYVYLIISQTLRSIGI